MDLGPEEFARLDLGLPSPLRTYQWEGISFLYASESALLADEMGLGKTVQAAIAIRLMIRAGAASRVLIVCPAALALNWARELARWAPELVVQRVAGSDNDRSALYNLPIDVLVASYEQVRVDALDKIPAGAFDLVVLDEAQRIKNRDSQTALACRLLPRSRSWALSATPLENSRSDLESVFGFVKPGLLNRRMTRPQVLGTIAPHMLRRRKSEVLGELPPVIVQDLFLELAPEQQRTYDSAWGDRSDALASEEKPVSTTTLFALLTRLKQICNFDLASGASSKADAVLTLVEAPVAAGEKVIVFSQYVDSLERLAERLQGIPFETYHGGLSAAARDDIVTRFESDSGGKVLLMSLRAGGVGLNLQAASLVVLFDRWWNPAVEIQAMYRAHRFDRKTPLHVVRFLVRDTVEERISEILEEKTALFAEYVTSAPTAEVEPLSRTDLMRILELRAKDTD